MVEKGFKQPLFLLYGLNPKPDFPKPQFEMLKHSQGWIYLLKFCLQFSQDTKLSFKVIHSFCKN